MIYSRSAEYAIRSLVYLARIPDGKFAMVRQIAEKERIPAHFLAKILQELTRKGLLRSSKGPSGGFALKVPARQIKLLNLVEALDGNTLADSDGHDIRLDEPHRVQDCQPGRDRAARRVDVDGNILLGIFGFEKQHLGDDQVGDAVVNRSPHEDDVFLQ
jgi:Rrf2 family protein